jgi:hypothetical protein
MRFSAPPPPSPSPPPQPVPTHPSPFPLSNPLPVSVCTSCSLADSAKCGWSFPACLVAFCPRPPPSPSRPYPFSVRLFPPAPIPLPVHRWSPWSWTHCCVWLRLCLWCPWPLSLCPPPSTAKYPPVCAQGGMHWLVLDYIPSRWSLVLLGRAAWTHYGRRGTGLTTGRQGRPHYHAHPGCPYRAPPHTHLPLRTPHGRVKRRLSDGTAYV